MDPWWKKAVGTITGGGGGGGGEATADEYADGIRAAVAKATAQTETEPQEKHVAIALAATWKTAALQRELKRAVEHRLAKARHWKVGVKALLLVHRLLRDGSTAFSAEKLQHFSHVVLLQHVALTFRDRSTNPQSVALTAWVRDYAMLLANRLQCARLLRTDPLRDEGAAADAFGLGAAEALECAPLLQQLLDCVFPLGETARTASLGVLPPVRVGLDMVIRECGSMYAAINACLFRLLDHFFSMPRDRAFRVLSLFRLNLIQTRRIPSLYADFRAAIPGCELAGLPDLDVSTMEAFVPVLQQHIDSLPTDAQNSDPAPDSNPDPGSNPDPNEMYDRAKVKDLIDADLLKDDPDRDDDDDEAEAEAEAVVAEKAPAKDEPLLIEWGDDESGGSTSASNSETPNDSAVASVMSGISSSAAAAAAASSSWMLMLDRFVPAAAKTKSNPFADDENDTAGVDNGMISQHQNAMLGFQSAAVTTSSSQVSSPEDQMFSSVNSSQPFMHNFVSGFPVSSQPDQVLHSGADPFQQTPASQDHYSPILQDQSSVSTVFQANSSLQNFDFASHSVSVAAVHSQTNLWMLSSTPVYAAATPSDTALPYAAAGASVASGGAAATSSKAPDAFESLTSEAFKSLTLI